MNKSTTYTFGNNADGRPYGKLVVTELWADARTNSSLCSVVFTLERPQTVNVGVQKMATLKFNSEPSTVIEKEIKGKGSLVLWQGNRYFNHQADGTGSFTFKASIRLDMDWKGSQIGTISKTGTFKLTKINAYSKVNIQAEKITETTCSIKYKTDLDIDRLEYSLDGSTWTGVNVADGRQGTFNITALTPSTSYTVQTRVRNRASWKWSDPVRLSVQTLAYPYAIEMPFFVIGEEVTIKFYNPLNRNLTIYVIANGQALSKTYSTNGQYFTGLNDAQTQDLLYQAIPNAQTASYSVRVIANGHAEVRDGDQFTVDTAWCTPEMGNITYEDINQATIGITSNNQKIIQNKSRVQFHADGLAAKKYAALESVKVKVNRRTITIPIAGSEATGGNLVINSATDCTATVTLTDTRGLTVSKEMNIQMVEAFAPSTTADIERVFGTDTARITAYAYYAALTGRNEIELTFDCIKDGDSQPTVSGTLQDGIRTTVELDPNAGWRIRIGCEDILGSYSTKTHYLPPAVPVFFIDKDKGSLGVNCFPDKREIIQISGRDVECAYVVGDVVTLNKVHVSGCTDDTHKILKFTAMLPHDLPDVSLRIAELKLNVVHSSGGYLLDSSYVAGGVDVLVQPYTMRYTISTNRYLTFEIEKSSRFSGGLAKTPQDVTIESLQIEVGRFM